MLKKVLHKNKQISNQKQQNFQNIVALICFRNYLNAVWIKEIQTRHKLLVMIVLFWQEFELFRPTAGCFCCSLSHTKAAFQS